MCQLDLVEVTARLERVEDKVEKLLLLAGEKRVDEIEEAERLREWKAWLREQQGWLLL